MVAYLGCCVNSGTGNHILGLVALTGGRRAVLPSMHGRSFTAPLTREELRAEQRAVLQREPSKAS